MHRECEYASSQGSIQSHSSPRQARPQNDRRASQNGSVAQRLEQGTHNRPYKSVVSIHGVVRRRKPLRRGGPLRRRTPLKPISSKAAARQRLWAAVTRLAIANAHGRCQAALPGCLGMATEAHHKLPRRFGDDSLGNVLVCCRACHEWIERNREAAYALGLLVRGNGGAA
jgi:hypothetical protein